MITTSSISAQPPALRIGNCIDAIEYTSGFVATLRDSLELAANTYDSHLANRLYVCDYIERKLRKVVGDLESVRNNIRILPVPLYELGIARSSDTVQEGTRS